MQLARYARTSRLVLLSAMILAALLLSGCFGPQTPQEVAKAFWQAVIEQDARAALKYSTLNSPQEFDSFGMQWRDFKPVWGKVVIDGAQASVAVKLSGSVNGQAVNRQCVTYLVRQADVWKVDYKKTAEDLHGGALGMLIGTLSQMGNELSSSLDKTAKQLNSEIDRLSQKLQQMSDDITRQSESIMKQRAQQLQAIMQQLRDSIDRALRDRGNGLSDQDRQTMLKLSTDLDDSSSLLANPSARTLTACNNDMGMAHMRLSDIEQKVSADYKRQWRKLEQRFDKVMQEMLDELSRTVEQQQKQHAQ